MYPALRAAEVPLVDPTPVRAGPRQIVEKLLVECLESRCPRVAPGAFACWPARARTVVVVKVLGRQQAQLPQELRLEQRRAIRAA